MDGFSINNLILIDGLKRGKGEAYSYLVEKYHQKLCVYAFTLTHDHDKAEDIVQNVYLNIWQKRGKLKDNFSVQGFLYRAVYNQFIDLYRKEKSTMALEKKHLEALDDMIGDNSQDIEGLINIVKQEIQKLPPRCRQIFVLSKQEGLTNIEIAEYLNISIKSVEAHITKGFSIIRNKLGDKINSVLFFLFGLQNQ